MMPGPPDRRLAAANDGSSPPAVIKIVSKAIAKAVGATASVAGEYMIACDATGPGTGSGTGGGGGCFGCCRPHRGPRSGVMRRVWVARNTSTARVTEGSLDIKVVKGRDITQALIVREYTFENGFSDVEWVLKDHQNAEHFRSRDLGLLARVLLSVIARGGFHI